MKIKNVKKFIRSILIILGISILIIFLISKGTLSHKEIEYKSIIVSEGDTLWNIAKFNQTNNEYYKDKEIGYVLNDLMKINKLSNSNIYINQELLIPVV